MLEEKNNNPAFYHLATAKNGCKKTNNDWLSIWKQAQNSGLYKVTNVCKGLK